MPESTYHCQFEEIQEIKEFRGEGSRKKTGKGREKDRKEANSQPYHTGTILTSWNWLRTKEEDSLQVG